MGFQVSFTPAGSVPHPTLITAITTAGITSGLQYALDAGDSNSYSGTGQKWLDTSGNGQDFFRGDTGSSSTDDPTFNGVSGGQSSSEFWSFDGGDHFFYDDTLESYMSGAHLNNAVFTLMMVVSVGNVESNVLVGSRDPDPGMIWNLNGAGKNAYIVRNGSASTIMSESSDDSYVADTIYFLALSFDESVGSGGAFMYRDGAFSQVSSSNTFDSTYTSPSGAAGHWAMARNGVASEFSNGSKIYMSAAWNIALTKANLDSLFAEVQDRFGL